MRELLGVACLVGALTLGTTLAFLAGRYLTGGRPD